MQFAGESQKVGQVRKCGRYCKVNLAGAANPTLATQVSQEASQDHLQGSLS